MKNTKGMSTKRGICKAKEEEKQQNVSKQKGTQEN